jgi:stage II sporulation protein M
LFLNGAVITLVVRLVLEEQSVWYVIAGLAPHGIIEIPAYLMVMAASLSFGFAVLRGLFQPGYRPEVMPQAKANLRRLGIGLVLLVPAALIESFITPLFLGWFG